MTIDNSSSPGPAAALPDKSIEPAASPPQVQHLVHVLCLPLQLKRKAGGIDQPVLSIDEVVQSIAAHSTPEKGWHPLPKDSTPWSAVTPEQAWQARVYFHPFVRRFLYDKDRVRWLQRTDVKAMWVTLPATRQLDPTTCKLTVQRCLLALFQPDIACLLLELDYTATSDSPALQMHELQRLLDRVRRTYPPYFDEGPARKSNGDNDDPPVISVGGHCPLQVTLRDSAGQILAEEGRYAKDDYVESSGDVKNSGSWKPAWASHWKTLLAPLNTDSTPNDGRSLGVRQFGDDRAAIMSYVAFDHVRALNRGQWVRMCFANDHGDDPLPYAERFLTDFETKHTYDRYWYNDPRQCEHVDGTDQPSRILNCGYAFTYAGNQGCQYFFANATNGALFTFRHIYVFMGLIAHMQRAALLAASHQLTEMVTRNGTQIELPNRDEVRRFYDQFIEFTQTYWFDEITPQEQGQEIFTQWQKHLRIQPLYDEVRQELRDLAEYSELRASNRLNDNVARLGLASLVLAALAVITGLFGMNILSVGEKSIALEGRWWSVVSGDNFIVDLAWPFWFAVCCAFVSLGLFIFSVSSTFKRWLSR